MCQGRKQTVLMMFTISGHGIRLATRIAERQEREVGEENSEAESRPVGWAQKVSLHSWP